ncbi:MAG: phosphodiester glycosidase family protein [Verrucomicrobiota bacterium]
MRSIPLGFLIALATAIGLSLVTSLLVCAGLSPEVRPWPDAAAPLLGIFAGAYASARAGSWRSGAGLGLAFVAAWFAFWLYLAGRINPLAWITEGLPRLTLAHAAWWAAALLVAAAGGWARKLPPAGLTAGVTVAYLGALLGGATFAIDREDLSPPDGTGVEKFGPAADGTFGYLLTFDGTRPGFRVGIYDADSDDATPYDNANTSYLGQSLAALVGKLSFQAAPAKREVLAVINGGFFGASGLSVAHHEEPMMEDGRALYPVDLLRPKDQAWLLAINAPELVRAGRPRFIMAPASAWGQLREVRDVLGGVRPLRMEGRSLPLEPGAGATTLRCSRTSVGWSADGRTFYILTVFDPDGELASQLQRRAGRGQTGGWDVAEVQRFWEERNVPFALLFDGGESTQLAFRRADGGFRYVATGYQYGFTLGYLWQRPVIFTPPILPPAEGRRGVLDYLYVEASAVAAQGLPVR